MLKALTGLLELESNLANCPEKIEEILGSHSSQTADMNSSLHRRCAQGQYFLSVIMMTTSLGRVLCTSLGRINTPSVYGRYAGCEQPTYLFVHKHKRASSHPGSSQQWHDHLLNRFRSIYTVLQVLGSPVYSVYRECTGLGTSKLSLHMFT
jgi:hypothetical protein